MGLTEMVFGWQGAVAAEFLLTWVAIYFMFMRPRKNRVGRSDSRYHLRFHSRFKGWLKVNGEKNDVRGIDLNTAGALITSSVPLTPGSRVFLYIESERLMGWAQVRHCTRRRMFGYHVGLEFRGCLLPAMQGNWEFSSVTPE